MAREQQFASEQAWKIAIEEEKTEKLAKVNKLIERVKGMEIKQHEIRQDMEQKLRNVQEQTQEKYQMKLEQEVQRFTSGNPYRERTDSSFVAREVEDKMTSQRRALETVKQMLHQGRGETVSPEMDWDYYGVHDQTGEPPEQITGVHDPGRIRGGGKEFSKRAASMPLEGESYSQSYGTFGLSSVGKRYLPKIVRKDTNRLCVGAQTVRVHI